MGPWASLISSWQSCVSSRRGVRYRGRCWRPRLGGRPRDLPDYLSTHPAPSTTITETSSATASRSGRQLTPFDVDGCRLYTWCALDTLMFPALLGKTAAVFSRCASTGAPINLSVAPHELRCVEPAGVVMSLLLPDDSRDIRRSFCCNVHFFVSAQASSSWRSKPPQLQIVGVEH